MKTLTGLLTIIATTLVYATATAAVEENHHFYLQPDTFWHLPQRIDEEARTIDASGRYYGLNAGYEFVKFNEIYAAIEGSLSTGDIAIEIQDSEGYYAGTLNASKNRIEAQVGYPMKIHNLSVIPFSGAGEYFISKAADHSFNLVYIPIGIKTDYHFDFFNMGLKLTQLRYVYFSENFDEVELSGKVWNTGLCGYEISMPISFSTKWGWEASLEPYYLTLINEEKFVGGRISATIGF